MAFGRPRRTLSTHLTHPGWQATSIPISDTASYKQKTRYDGRGSVLPPSGDIILRAHARCGWPTPAKGLFRIVTWPTSDPRPGGFNRARVDARCFHGPVLTRTSYQRSILNMQYLLCSAKDHEIPEETMEAVLLLTRRGEVQGVLCACCFCILIFRAVRDPLIRTWLVLSAGYTQKIGPQRVLAPPK